MDVQLRLAGRLPTSTEGEDVSSSGSAIPRSRQDPECKWPMPRLTRGIMMMALAAGTALGISAVVAVGSRRA